MAQKIMFTKMHGCGNDYIYINTMEQKVPNPQEAAILWSDRHKGIGSDGLVLIGKSPIPEADYSMRIFNADGSEAMMCGNASRCIGKYLYEKALTTQTQIRLLTKSGIKTLHLHVNNGVVGSVTIDMGEPQLENAEQFIPSCGLDKGVFVSMGNPHYVIFTDNVDQVGELGRMLEHHPAFPQRCNIEFARVDTDPIPDPSPTREGSGSAAVSAASPAGLAAVIRTRVWERGSGITQACGTGACAAAVAAHATGRTGRKVTVEMDGGRLEVERREADGHVWLTGGAETVFEGCVSV